MLSRVANAVYWMNRYLERAENYARFIDVNYNLSLEMPHGLSEQWKPLVVTTGDWQLFDVLHGEVNKTNVIHFLGFREDNPSSIYNCIKSARENARTIRPEITKEVWEQVNALYYLVQDGKDRQLWKDDDPREFFAQIKSGCQLLYGMFDATISRNDGWHFGNLGKLIERADKTSRILDVKYHMLHNGTDEIAFTKDLIQSVALLKSASAYDMYRKKHGKLNPSTIAQFLIFDTDFPRAMLRCLMIAEKSLNVVAEDAGNVRCTTAKKLGKLKSRLEYSDISDLPADEIHQFLDDFQSQLNDISAAIFEDFFSITNVRERSSERPPV